MSTSNSSQTRQTLSIDSQTSSSASVDSQSIDGFPKAVAEKGYKLGEKLGSGAFSTVYKATNANKPGVVLACKRFDLTDATQEVWREKCLKSEMKIMMRLKHPNIVKAYDVIKTRKMAFIFMAFAQNGSVGDFLEKTGKPVEESQAKKWFHDITSAVSHIHSKGIAHRDIKPDNFLLDNDYKDALLTDFGFSCMALDNERLLKGTNCGTDLYKGPELLTLPEGSVYDPKKTDVYAMGVSLFEMLNHNKPFSESIDYTDSSGITNYVRKQKTRKFNYNRNVKLSPNAVKFLELLFEPDPNRRVDVKTLLKQKWFDSK